MLNTKSVNYIPSEWAVNYFLLTKAVNQHLDMLKKAFDELVQQKIWVGINDYQYYYVKDGFIIPNAKKVKLDAYAFKKLPKLKWQPMNKRIANKWFYSCKSSNPMMNGYYITYVDVNNNSREVSYIFYSDENRCMSMNDATTIGWAINYTDSIKIPIYELNTDERNNIILFLIRNGFNVFEGDLSNLFQVYEALYQKGLFDRPDKQISLEKLAFFLQEFENNGITLSLNQSDLTNEQYVMESEKAAQLKALLLDCDKRRIHMESYPEHILHDPESGHWDLWDNGNGTRQVNIGESLVARNPVFDAMNNKSGVVGIDFGTKSTVVMYRQSRADVLPMRIGSGQFSREISKSDYENPTVMELRNVKKFLDDYRLYDGRPETCWEDLLISHEASEQMKSEQSEGDSFATFFSELKQWASDKERQVHLQDSQRNNIHIPPYLSLSENDFDPIEIYAYYLGLFINNMVHKIYLRYKLSFPATVEKQVRDKILTSFTKGIKKSLPIQVLKDEACMQIFKVEQGASEPAAYAITALCEYKFDPGENEKYYYGIFDFGGGTTDFDFGVWSCEDEEPENYDYQISHFGQGGDPHLGGENLLAVLAYHVFVKNFETLRKDGIVFIRPTGEKEILGGEHLIRQDSQYAHFNHKRLMEKLRGVWEGDEEVRESVKSGTIALPLFTINGESKDNYAIEVDLDELDALLESRIDRGVSQFYDAMKNCFGVNKNQKDIHDVDGIHIFLAGNSSKSPLVYKIFKKYIDIYVAGLKQREGEKKDWFKLYPPLGTPASKAILQGKLNPLIDDIYSFIQSDDEGSRSTDDALPESDMEDLAKPTGKTGVAYGLLNNRVRVIQNESEEIPFRYYIGQNRKNKFYCVINKDVQSYNTWVRFCKASREDFDIWFTRSPEAPANSMPIDCIGVYSETGFISDPADDSYVYIRLIAPTEIEYVVATEDDVRHSTYDNQSVIRVSLQEKQ